MNRILILIVCVISIMAVGILGLFSTKDNAPQRVNQPRIEQPPFTVTPFPYITETIAVTEVVSPLQATSTNSDATQPPFIVTSTPLQITMVDITTDANDYDSVIVPVLSLEGTYYPDPVRETEASN